MRSVRDTAYALVLDLPADTPVILTNWYSQDSPWGIENWEAVIALARKRGCPLFVVVLSCSPEENERRIQSPERAGKRKPRNIEMVQSNVNQRPLLDHGGDRLLRLDVTDLSADEAAGQIAGWLTMEQTH